MAKHVRSGPGYHVGLARHDFVINSHIHQKDTTQTYTNPRSNQPYSRNKK